MTGWRLGTIGFGYEPWQGIFYPVGLPASRQLAHYSQHFNAVEVDSTFYGIPRPGQLERWAGLTPDGFIFCLKTPRQITHERRLAAGELMAKFTAVARTLDAQLGPILVQLPPDFSTAETAALVAFLAGLPGDLRFAVEFRHPSWEQAHQATVGLLARHNVAWVTADYIHLSTTIYRTTDFLYIRWLGEHGRFPAKDREQLDVSQPLANWWSRLQPHLPAVSAVYGFFNNDYAGYSPATANRFKQLVGLPVSDIRQPQQGRLF